MIGHRRLLPVLAALALLAGLAGPAASAASAAPAAPADGGTATAPDVVLFNSCHTYPVTYTSTIPAGASLWRLQVMVYDPDGFTSQGLVADSGASDPTSGTFEISFCGSETPGTWTIKTTGYYELLPVLRLPFTESDTTFTVRRAQTTTQLRSTAVRHGRWRVRADVREEDPQGFVKAEGAHVQLQRLLAGQWVEVPRSVLTTTRGRASVTVALKRGTRLRGVTRESGNHAGSVSAPITLKRR